MNTIRLRLNDTIDYEVFEILELEIGKCMSEKLRCMM